MHLTASKLLDIRRIKS